MENEKIFTLKEYLQVIDNAYVTGKANVSVEEKEKMIDHLKKSAVDWANKVQNKKED